MSHHRRDPAPKHAPYPIGKGKGAQRPVMNIDPLAIMPAEHPPVPEGRFEEAIPEQRQRQAIERRAHVDGNNRTLETFEHTDDMMVDSSGQMNIHVTNIRTLTQQALMGGVDEAARSKIINLTGELRNSQDDQHRLFDMIGQSHRINQDAQNQTAARLNELRAENNLNVEDLQQHVHQLSEQFNHRINAVMQNFQIMTVNMQNYSLKNEETVKTRLIS